MMYINESYFEGKLDMNSSRAMKSAMRSKLDFGPRKEGKRIYATD